mgnify:CR=1 FL=1
MHKKHLNSSHSTLTNKHTRLARASIVYATLIVAIAALRCGDRNNEAVSASRQIRIEVEAQRARRQTLNKTRVFSGVLEPLRQVDITPLPLSPGGGAKVERLYVDVGDHVRRGQLLAEMDDGELVRARATFQPLKAQYKRARRLYDGKAMARARYEEIEAAYLAKKRQVSRIRENTTIRAPFSGVITDRTVQEGEIYTPQAGLGRNAGLFRLTQLDPLKVDLDVDEHAVAHLKEDMSVTMKTQAPDDTVITAKVLWVNPSAHMLSHTFKVRLLAPNPRHALKAGHFVQARIVLERKTDALSVPPAALVEGNVYVVRDGTAFARPVRLGWQCTEYVEILSGIAAGDLVVVSGNKALPDSAAVIVANTHPSH